MFRKEKLEYVPPLGSTVEVRINNISRIALKPPVARNSRRHDFAVSSNLDSILSAGNRRASTICRRYDVWTKSFGADERSSPQEDGVKDGLFPKSEADELEGTKERNKSSVGMCVGNDCRNATSTAVGHTSLCLT